MEVCVVSTGTANLASVGAWLRRAGATPRVSVDPRDVEGAPALVVPGVGAFGAAMEELNARGLVEAIRRRIAEGRPTLGICLGMQILFGGSEESPGVAGLGVFPGTVRRLPPTVRVPHMGWNAVAAPSSCDVLRSGSAYFANSFAVVDAPSSCSICRAEHGVSFVSALERGPVVACQFHPELSGDYGKSLLERWLAAARSERVAC